MIKLLILYWTLLQSTLGSFTGLQSIPVIRHELIVERHWIDDQQLSAALIIGRSTPGPMGVYIVCVGYFVAGYPGAVMAALALMTPALLIVLLFRLLGSRIDDPRVKNAIRFVIIGGTAFSASALVGMGQSAFTTWWLVGLGALSALLLLRTKVATIWILVGAGIVSVMVK